MPKTPNKVKAHTGGTVTQQVPHEARTGHTTLPVNGTSTNKEKKSHVHFAPPFPTGAKVVNATLRMTHARDAAGSHTLHVKRVTKGWRDDNNTWNNQPPTTPGNEGTVNVIDPIEGDVEEIDVTDLYGDVGDGSDYYGLELSLPADTDADDELGFYSPDAANADNAPELELDWRMPPYAPVSLSPASGNAIGIASPKVAWQFTTATSEAGQAYSQIQIASDPAFTTILHDTGKVANTDEFHDLTGDYAISPDQTVYWRVKVWDDSNIESGWSDGAQIVRRNFGALTILNPAASPNNYVTETTPPITWTFTGRAQNRASVHLFELKGKKLFEVWAFHEQVKTDDIGTPNTYAVTVPHGIIKSGKTYRVLVSIWDDQGRESIAGSPAFVDAQRDFTYQRDGTPDPPTGLGAVPWPLKDANTPAGPGFLLKWSRAVEPDYFSIRVDGGEDFDRLDPVNLIQPDGTYEFVWWRGAHGHDYTIEVEAVVIDAGNHIHKHSSNNPTVVVTPTVKGKWLVDEEDNTAVMLADTDQVSLAIGESATTYDLPGSRKPVRITETIRGYEGSVSGVLSSVADKSVFEDLKGRMSILRYISRKLNIPIRLADVSQLAPRSSQSSQDWWLVAFDLFQVDEFSIDVEG